MCRNEELMPNDLFPSNKSKGTVSPIKGPAIYHGHGCLKKSIIFRLEFKIGVKHSEKKLYGQF